MDLFDNNGAIFSDDRKYRYALWRIWDPSKPLVMFIGLNPSTANEAKSDPTITRVKSFARHWGYGGVYMMNLFAIVSSKPAILISDPDPLGENDIWIDQVAAKCDMVVFAWGAFRAAKTRSKAIIEMFPTAKALTINADGSPKHPLYVPGNIELINFNHDTNPTT